MSGRRTVEVPALSAIPGLVHGFEQRAAPGGETRERGRARVARALEGRGRLLTMKQVHGSAVLEAPWDGTLEGDAALATRPGDFLGIETADCLPVFVVDPRLRMVAAVHAGWRGTAARVLTRAVEALVVRGSVASDLIAAVGPGIGPCCYEVGGEVRAAFGEGGDGFFGPGPRGRPHLDLRAANVRQLLDTGIPPQRIHHVAECTRCRSDLYHSYRREGPGGGRMMSFVGFALPRRPLAGE